MAVLGASGGGHLPQITITTSLNWSPPIDGNVCFHVIGAGSGGYGSTLTDSNSGAAGGYCKKNSVAVVTTDVFAIAVGVGGAGGNGGAGGAGGNTTVEQTTGSGLSAVLTANGGSASGTSATTGGGTASNGDVNNTGGDGVRNYQGAGGSVGIYGTGDHGGVSAGNTYHAMGSNCDSAGGGLAMSGYGHIVGGTKGGPSVYCLTGSGAWGGLDGGDLCGGGSVYSSESTYVYGGHGGIGGGGGSARAVSAHSSGKGGFGGDGIVLIQYLP